MRIEQEARLMSEGHWRWAVWVEGTPAELDEIESVEYTLHPTFPEPVRLMRNRAVKFRIEDWAWGEFEINAHAFIRGEARHLKHWLVLEGPGGRRAPAKETTPKVFVSYAAADAGWGEEIQQAFEERGFETITMEDTIEVGSPWQSAITSAINDADLVVGVFSDTPSRWVTREVTEALAQNVEVVSMAVGDEAQVPDMLASTQIVNVTGPDDLAPAIDSLVARTRAH